MTCATQSATGLGVAYLCSADSDAAPPHSRPTQLHTENNDTIPAAALAPTGMARWQTVEAALAALHLVGEGAHDGAVKPGVEESPLGELVEMLLSRWDVVGSNSPRVATHRLVAPALLEICVRYHLAIERRPALLQPALSAFMDARVRSFLFGYLVIWLFPYGQLA